MEAGAAEAADSQAAAPQADGEVMTTSDEFNNLVTAQPDWSRKYLSPVEIGVIEAGIGKAEAKTRGEIVPVFVERSVSLHHVPMLVSGFVSILSAIVSIAVLLSLRPEISLLDSLEIVGVIFALALVVGRYGLARWSVVQRLFTSKQDAWEAVHNRAELEFHRTGIPATQGYTGVMIFVSVFERRALIMGDRAISDKMTEEAWVGITTKLVQRLAGGQFQLGFSEAIEAVGQKLAQEFPQSSHDQNELPNKLVIH